MERQNLIYAISSDLKIDEKIVSQAIEIIENTKRTTADDIYFANQIASNMEISPKYATEIAMKYTRYKNKQLNEIKEEELIEKDKKIKKIIIFIILLIVVIIIASVILAL